MKEWLEKAVGKGWTLTPAGGLTGDAYIATKDNHKLFVKRNSSPFLAVLSAVGIVPKLIWTKRMENGDVITAQEWLEGRDLTKEDMKSGQIMELLKKIHHSPELLHMLMRLGKKPVTSDQSLLEIEGRLVHLGLLEQYEEVAVALNYLVKLLPITRNQKLVVCHCDLNHNNLLMSESGEIFLVDWDNAMIADPVIDFGFLLKWYIPKEEWDEWLEKYGVTEHEYLYERMHWYLLLNALDYLSWHSERHEADKVKERLESLSELNQFMESMMN
ncbi:MULTISPECIES: phosphotransferase family protein [unclassified Oceanobacillus]|uniref:phosphotransferase family protein n=1 Tax=unclassified Oceanobacillus TaxID=2630292 RepID=UPI00300DF3F3